MTEALVLSADPLQDMVPPMTLKDTLTEHQATELQRLMMKEPLTGIHSQGMKQLLDLGLAVKDKNGNLRVAWDKIPRPPRRLKPMPLNENNP